MQCRRAKLIERVLNDPVVPLEWGRNKPGMSADDVADRKKRRREAERVWLEARDAAVEHARRLLELEDPQARTQSRPRAVLVAHGDRHRDASGRTFFSCAAPQTRSPEIRKAATGMREAIDASVPAAVEIGGWHLPLVQADERGAGYRGAEEDLGGALRARFVSDPRGRARDREGSRTARSSQDGPSPEPVRARRDARGRRGVPRKLPRLAADAPRNRSGYLAVAGHASSGTPLSS